MNKIAGACTASANTSTDKAFMGLNQLLGNCGGTALTTVSGEKTYYWLGEVDGETHYRMRIWGDQSGGYESAGSDDNTHLVRAYLAF